MGFKIRPEIVGWMFNQISQDQHEASIILDNRQKITDPDDLWDNEFNIDGYRRVFVTGKIPVQSPFKRLQSTIETVVDLYRGNIELEFLHPNSQHSKGMTPLYDADVIERSLQHFSTRREHDAVTILDEKQTPAYIVLMEKPKSINVVFGHRGTRCRFAKDETAFYKDIDMASTIMATIMNAYGAKSATPQIYCLSYHDIRVQ